MGALVANLRAEFVLLPAQETRSDSLGSHRATGSLRNSSHRQGSVRARRMRERACFSVKPSAINFENCRSLPAGDTQHVLTFQMPAFLTSDTRLVEEPCPDSVQVPSPHTGCS